MSYEVTIPLKVGTLEIEFDGVPELERRLRGLDIARIERAVLAAVHGEKKKGKKAKKAKRR